MEQNHTTMMLSEVADGKSLRVCKVDADKDAKRRLANLGLLPGVEIRKRHAAPLHGPVEIEVRGSILAIGQGIARKILVDVEAG